MVAAPPTTAEVAAPPVETSGATIDDITQAEVNAGNLAQPSMTMEELNDLLVVELTRLGGNQHMQKILTVLNAPPFSAANLSTLDVSKYQDLLTAVKAIEV